MKPRSLPWLSSATRTVARSDASRSERAIVSVSVSVICATSRHGGGPNARSCGTRARMKSASSGRAGRTRNPPGLLSFGGGSGLIADVREASRIGRPRVDVDAPLAAGECDDDLRSNILDDVARHRDEAELHLQSALVVSFGSMRER